MIFKKMSLLSLALLTIPLNACSTKYVVTFHFNRTVDGISSCTANVNDGGTVKEISLNDPDYTLVGWYTDNETFKHPFDFRSIIHSNLELYGKWQKTIKRDDVINAIQVNESRTITYYNSMTYFHSEFRTQFSLINNGYMFIKDGAIPLTAVFKKSDFTKLLDEFSTLTPVKELYEITETDEGRNEIHILLRSKNEKTNCEYEVDINLNGNNNYKSYVISEIPQSQPINYLLNISDCTYSNVNTCTRDAVKEKLGDSVTKLHDKVSYYLIPHKNYMENTNESTIDSDGNFKDETTGSNILIEFNSSRFESLFLSRSLKEEKYFIKEGENPTIFAFFSFMSNANYLYFYVEIDEDNYGFFYDEFEYDGEEIYSHCSYSDVDF